MGATTSLPEKLDKHSAPPQERVGKANAAQRPIPRAPDAVDGARGVARSEQGALYGVARWVPEADAWATIDGGVGAAPPPASTGAAGNATVHLDGLVQRAEKLYSAVSIATKSAAP